ncbi:MAG: Glycoside hydrolase family 9 [Candidatus Yanofskybacteria bacterium GW2011_GWF1_44_227]|nr:MAG: Glycoside hydrolase family 9 [Candidatus Yanofskybacteria bacterium GW2011_GWF1_44_227]
MRYSLRLFIAVVCLGLPTLAVNADGLTVNAVLNVSTPPAKSLDVNAQLADLAKIDISSTFGDLHLTGFQLGTDTINGLQNFANIVVYNVTAGANTVVKEYPATGDQPDILSFSQITINYQTTKTFMIRGTPSSSATGIVRVGFKNLIFGDTESVTQVGVPIYGNAVTLPGTVVTPTPIPSATPSPSFSPTPSGNPNPVNMATPVSRGFTSLTAINLTEGDTISAINSTDPDIYIANAWGYKRLFLNPIIFNFYGHLGGFNKVKSITSTVRDTMVTSGLIRNCETDDQKVYGIETTGEDEP